MRDERQALFQGVLDDPDAEAPRRAFAAWLDARGEPQGEFIRLQLEASRELRKEGHSTEYIELGRRATELRSRYGADWSRPVDSIASEPRFYRGFVEGVTIGTAEFLSRADQLYRAAPIRHITFTGARGAMAALAASPALARLVSIGLQDNQLGDGDVQAFAASPHLGRLRRLTLAWNEIGEQGLEALFASSSLTGLAYLNFEGNRVKSPTEEWGEDWATGRIVPESVSLPEAGQRLESRYGTRPWLHAPTLLRHFPPSEEEL